MKSLKKSRNRKRNTLKVTRRPLLAVVIKKGEKNFIHFSLVWALSLCSGLVTLLWPCHSALALLLCSGLVTLLWPCSGFELFLSRLGLGLVCSGLSWVSFGLIWLSLGQSGLVWVVCSGLALVCSGLSSVRFVLI